MAQICMYVYAGRFSIFFFFFLPCCVLEEYFCILSPVCVFFVQFCSVDLVFGRREAGERQDFFFWSAWGLTTLATKYSHLYISNEVIKKSLFFCSAWCVSV